MGNCKIYFDREKLRDRIYACWIGKNIGGTMGYPYEGTQELLDIQGFETDGILPNDDLDLQLVWLRALDEMGPESVNEHVLGEYWLSYIGPAWNEYGICKSNLREGLMPPMSGQVYNDRWKHSNGAWIRTEVWACLFPGCPEKAIRYAFYDACVDHGYNEGTYAAIFVAAMESAAFVYQNTNILLDIGLSKIPADCRIAKAIRLVREEHAKGTDWKTVRNMLVKQSADIGWFQAPANVAYVVLGLLYGEGDFKKSMILTINCGDDTDCTAATIGSIMGIQKGTGGIPADWHAHIGDKIVTKCNMKGHGNWHANNTELTDHVMSLLPCTLRQTKYYDSFYDEAPEGYFNTRKLHKYEPELTDHDDFSALTPDSFTGDDFVRSMFRRSPYSFRQTGIYSDVWVEFDTAPEIQPNGTLTGRILVQNRRMHPAKHHHLRWFLPEGWTIRCKTNLAADIPCSDYTGPATTTFCITAGDKVEPNNRLVLEVSSVQRPTCLYVPVTILG